MMRTVLLTLSFAAAILATGGSALATGPAPRSHPGFDVEILVDGRPSPQHMFRGTRYVEAHKGLEYSVRLRNPLPVRVAVALAVDGLNSIDARHTDARSARKWVLSPYETVTIRGWQTSMADARSFYFTTEDQSYATRLGQPANQGLISAVFFRERATHVVPILAAPSSEADARRDAPARSQRSLPSARPEAAPPAAEKSAERSAALGAVAEDYAATGIGRRVDNAVRQVYLDLEEQPAAVVDIRYEYRPQLVKLGVLPPEPLPDDPIDRRQHARGFTPGFCPIPK